MLPPDYFTKTLSSIKNFQKQYGLSRCFVLLFIFFLAVLLVSYIIPLSNYGRYVGTDDYTHVIYTGAMDSSTGIYDFYSRMGQGASDPENPENFYNYPFGLWLFGSLVSKFTGLSVFAGNFIVVFLFLIVIMATFYLYSGVFLDTKEQKITALLFMVSMPNIVLILLNYRPSVFVLPFLFIVFFIVFQDKVHWKMYPVLWLSVFIITICHTGTFLFLISATLGFFLLYSLFWGKFSNNFYITIVSTFLIYLLTLSWFPEIANQYATKSTLFLSPGNFLANKFNLTLVRDFGNIFYQNFFVGQQFVYALLFSIAMYGAAIVLIAIHNRVSGYISNRKIFPAVVLPIQNISHSALASPIWLGPMHVFLSLVGFFRIDAKGKCLFITVLFTTLLPDLLNASEGIEVATGALREIQYLVVIIPITATFGLFWILSSLNKSKVPHKSLITFIVWFFVLSAVILTSAVGTTYYLPKIAGENYSVNGMKWLGENADTSEKVEGYGIRTVSIFTRMPGPSIEDGSETREFRQLLQDIHFSSGNQEQYAKTLRQVFDVKYLLSSDKILANIGRTPLGLTIDNNNGLDKIYSSQDFGIYEVTSSAADSIQEYDIAQDTSIKKSGSVYRITSEYYTATLDENTPVLTRLGSKQKNYFGAGFLTENIIISGNLFVLGDMQFSSELRDNQIVYTTMLKKNTTDYASLLVRYSFYPKVVKREYIISNDWIGGNKSSVITPKFSSLIFSPLSNYIITNNKEQQVRKIFESQDSVAKTIKVEDIYMFKTGNQLKQGIRIKNVHTSPFPGTVYYKGSTLYDLSSISTAQSQTLPSGSTFHITQFLSTGDELGTENNIASQNGIELINYPDGIKPVVICGSGSPDPGYTVMQKYGIPYCQIISQAATLTPETDLDVPLEEETGTESTEETDTFQETPVVEGLLSTNEKFLTKQGVTFIGSAPIVHRNFDNLSTQKKTISSLVDYTRSQGVSLSGFLPPSFRFNLDTIKALNDNHVSFMFSNSAIRPIQGFFDEGYRNPQMAYYHGEPTSLVMMPVSYPASSSLYVQEDPSGVFSQWQDILNEGADNNELIVFFFNAADIGDSAYSDKFMNLFSNAQDLGYTFTDPDRVADHFRQLQNIEYSGYTDMDTASITVTNNNNETVHNVTFKVDLAALSSGSYVTSTGKIVKTEKVNTTVSVYVSTDIPAHTTQNVVLTPDSPRKSLNVRFPPIISEGWLKIKVTDSTGNPVKDAEVIFDTSFYRTGKDGTVTVDAHRGTYMVIIQSPGYEKYTNLIEVKGRIAQILQYFNIR